MNLAQEVLDLLESFNKISDQDLKRYLLILIKGRGGVQVKEAEDALRDAGMLDSKGTFLDTKLGNRAFDMYAKLGGE